MNRLLRITLHLAVLTLSFVPAVIGQDAVPGEILQRTLFIKAGNEYGTAFSIDDNGKLYLATAKHVVTGLGTSNATIQIGQSGTWKDYQIPKILFPPSEDVDIAVLETTEKVPQPFKIGNISKSGGTTFGQQVWFLGYPWGIHTRAGGAELPFIKRGTLSAIDGTNQDAVIYYIDGFNNPGFSGGPILYWDFSDRAYKICGVVKGYKEDTAKILVNGEHVDTQLLVNSGILVGYSIRHAIQAIEKERASEK